MKKIFLVLVTLLFLNSCGPHRLSCGPGKRCVETSKKNDFDKIENNKKKINV
jgi:hypothetical protein